MMQRLRPASTARPFALAAMLVALSACTTTTPKHHSLVVGQQATIEGRIVSVDTNPWAYDGNAVVVVSIAGGGSVGVQLPARWNLCKAQPLGDVQALAPGDRVQAIGTATGPAEMVVCEQPEHRLRRIE
jgi:hypothetical protein